MKRIRNQRGMSLLEVMIAMIILAFGILGLAPIIVVSMFGNSYSNQVTVADALAQSKIEDIKSWATVDSIPYYQIENNVAGVFTRETNIDDSTSDASIPPGVYGIRVTISWTDQKEIPRSVYYLTFKAKE